MSQENVETVRRAFEALLNEDMPGAVAEMHPEIEIHDFDIPDAGLYHGHDGFQSWIAAWGEAWASWKPEDLVIQSIGPSRVIATFKMIATGHSSGVEIERLDAVIYDFRDGKIVRQEYFNDRAEALEAAGLSE